MYYADLRELLASLEKKGKLVRVKEPINKDTELMPLVRWQFRGLPEKERKAFLFENVTDVKGRRYDIPVAVGTHGSSREIYALAMNCKAKEIQEKWVQAQHHPILPQIVEAGPVQDIALTGPDLEKEGGGLEQFPIPISTPGFDPAPFFSAPCWVTKDPETRVTNVGTYRAQVKSRTRTGILSSTGQHLAIHWKKAKKMGKPLEAALVIGGPPCLGLVSISKLPYEMDELAVAGGIAGEPLKLVKCQSVNLEVPATAEIVLEGILPTDQVEPEGPFGEYTGYMGQKTVGPYFEISCITHRRNPIFHAFLSQFPPNEGSKISNMTQEANLYKFLRYDCNVPGVLEVALDEESGRGFMVIRLKKDNAIQPWQVLNSAAGYSTNVGKYIVVVDEDIDPRDLGAVVWAMTYRSQPHLDTRVTHGCFLGLDPSIMRPGVVVSEDMQLLPNRQGTSALLIDATRKWDYPPISLPAREHMERARHIWENLGFPRLTPREPWYGYPLGVWTQENEDEAELALKGEHFITGEKLAKERKKA